jgi:hypothetical protein
VRNPMVLHVTHPQLTLCFLENPIQFDALDGQPVSALFALISPTVKTHLHLLSLWVLCCATRIQSGSQTKSPARGIV